MDWWLWVTAGGAAAGAVLAIRRAARLKDELAALRREQRDIQSRLKQTTEDLREAAQTLRFHLAKVAEGGRVPPQMILQGTRYVTLSAPEAQRLWESEPDRLVLVDVRTPREYAVKRVPGARLLPLEELEARYEKEIPEAAERVLIYCASGDRSRLACDFLSRKGYTNLYHVRDGIQGWTGPTEGEGPVTLIQIEKRS